MARGIKPGDLIRVKEGVHEEGMPDKRIGLVISEWHPKGSDRNPKMRYTSIYNVKMLNGHQMKIHEMFLETIQEGTNVQKEK